MPVRAAAGSGEPAIRPCEQRGGGEAVPPWEEAGRPPPVPASPFQPEGLVSVFPWGRRGGGGSGGAVGGRGALLCASSSAAPSVRSGRRPDRPGAQGADVAAPVIGTSAGLALAAGAAARDPNAASRDRRGHGPETAHLGAPCPQNLQNESSLR